jgi:hypothetical protein
MNELLILQTIQRNLKYDIECMIQSERQREEIVNQIAGLNNDFFPLKCNEYLFTSYILKDEMYEDTLEHLRTLLKMIESKIQNVCEHEWVYDSIDLTPEQSQTICYCGKCEVTRDC